MEDGRYVAHQDRVVFGDLLDGLVIDYTNTGRRSIDTLPAPIKPVRTAFGLDRAVDGTEPRVERYKDARLRAKKAPATVNRELAVIRRAFRLAVRQEAPCHHARHRAVGRAQRPPGVLRARRLRDPLRLPAGAFARLRPVRLSVGLFARLEFVTTSGLLDRAILPLGVDSIGSSSAKGGDAMLLVLFVLLAVLWVLGWLVFHVAGSLIHLLLLVAVVSLILHFARGRAM
jgi:hypothetical protein